MEKCEKEKMRPHPAMYVEDGLIIVSIVLLFVLTVFYRHLAWAQVSLLAVLAVMTIVFVRRLTRAHRAFTRRQ